MTNGTVRESNDEMNARMRMNKPERERIFDSAHSFDPEEEKSTGNNFVKRTAAFERKEQKIFDSAKIVLKRKSQQCTVVTTYGPRIDA